MTTTTHDPLTDDLEQFVRLGVAGGGVSLHWRVTLPHQLEHAARILHVAGPYNQFDPDAIVETITAFRDHVSTVELAREYSMAVYFTLADWRHQAMSAPREPGKWLEQSPENRISDHETRNVTSILVRGLIGDDASEVSWWGHKHGIYGGGALGVVVRSHIYGPDRPDPEPIADDTRPYQVRAWWD